MKLSDLKGLKFDWNSILSFCRKNIRYISAGGIMVVLVIVLAVTVPGRGADTKPEDKTGEEQNNEDQDNSLGAFKAADPEINTLITNYFTAYAAGDVEKIITYAQPVSDMEKSYIELMSQFIASYDNIQCFTKKGLSEDEYAVSVRLDMHFEGVEASAPGLDFFYVRKDEGGAYYIDNLYSQFNLQNREQQLDSSVDEYISVYENQKDMVEMCTDVQSGYESKLSSDSNLKKMVETTIPQAQLDWVAKVTGTENQPDNQNPDNQNPDNQNPDNQTPAENTGSKSEKVYVTSNLNIRKKPDASSELVGTAIIGQSFTRTAVREDGWSEIEYYGGKAYIKSDYLSTQAPKTN